MEKLTFLIELFLLAHSCDFELWLEIAIESVHN